MRLMRHTSLATTTKYMRTVEKRMREAVENLGNAHSGGDSGGDSMAASGAEMSHLAKLAGLRELTKMLEKQGFDKGFLSGGGQIRTVDAADMSRGSENGESPEIAETTDEFRTLH